MKHRHPASTLVFRILPLSAMALSFIVVQAEAQGININSPDRCGALAGSSWQTRDGRTACWVKWSKEQCQGVRGTWHERSESCALPVGPGPEQIKCEERGGAWGRHGSQLEYCYLESDRTACLDSGGEW